MTERIWDKFLTERDKEVFKAAGYGQRAGFGKRPALLVVDVNYGFCGDKREPVLESIKRWRQSGGEAAWDALPILQRLIATARDREIPVIYTTGVKRADNWDRGSWSWKNRRSGERPAATNHDPNEIMPQIAPGPRDIVVYKQKPSGFHGTNLLAYLVHLGCDSILLAGTATSGCVRATAIDAFSYNFRVTMIEDGCFERSEVSHAISLFDLNSKYADVVMSDEVIAYMEGLPRGLFELPPGNGAA
ncbi:MAG TPA: isochorismatase family protein [Xanthobacteraceae bacterium]|jgi:nicotinamidase-related amidase|nr:isochorismatase family protein [Xanthobacteraceae bacterium]